MKLISKQNKFIGGLMNCIKNTEDMEKFRSFYNNVVA